MKRDCPLGVASCRSDAAPPQTRADPLRTLVRSRCNVQRSCGIEGIRSCCIRSDDSPMSEQCKECVCCYSRIDPRAKVCKVCGRSQNRIARWLTSSGFIPTLSLLIAGYAIYLNYATAPFNAAFERAMDTMQDFNSAVVPAITACASATAGGFHPSAFDPSAFEPGSFAGIFDPEQCESRASSALAVFHRLQASVDSDWHQLDASALGRIKRPLCHDHLIDTVQRPGEQISEWLDLYTSVNRFQDRHCPRSQPQNGG